jgi:biopolymer transport protein ExbB/TolQ
MGYRVVYDTDLSVIGKSQQFPLEILLIVSAILLVLTVWGLFLIKKRVSRLEAKVTLLESKISKISLNVSEFTSKFSRLNLKPTVSEQTPQKEKRLTELEVERIAELITSKAPVKINKDKLKELIMKRDIKALAKALKMSLSEVEILLKL